MGAKSAFSKMLVESKAPPKEGSYGIQQIASKLGIAKAVKTPMRVVDGAYEAQYNAGKGIVLTLVYGDEEREWALTDGGTLFASGKMPASGDITKVVDPIKAAIEKRQKSPPPKPVIGQPQKDESASDKFARLVEATASIEADVLAWLADPKNRKKAANTLYANTHKDFKGKFEDGTRTVMLNGNLVPIDSASAADLARLLKGNSKSMGALNIAKAERAESTAHDEPLTEAKALKWEDKKDGIFVVITEVGFIDERTKKVDKIQRVALRIDGRKKGIFRVDVKPSAIEPWEAIDGGEEAAPKSLKDAKALAAKWMVAAAQQRTTTPSMSGAVHEEFMSDRSRRSMLRLAEEIMATED